jgi:broad specificity phosphatase PhoE
MTQEQAARHLKPMTQPVIDWQMYPLAETLRQFYSRTVDYMQELVEGQDRVLLLVTHRGVIQNAITWWLRLGVEVLGKASFRCAPASITILDEGEWGERRVERLNDTSHLYAARLPDRLRL